MKAVPEVKIVEVLLLVKTPNFSEFGIKSYHVLM
jgi:hypothetical protein